MPTLSSSKLIKSRIKFMTTYRVPPTISPEAIKYKDDTKKISPDSMREGREVFNSDIRSSLLRELSNMYSANKTESLSSLVARMASRDREVALEQ